MNIGLPKGSIIVKSLELIETIINEKIDRKKLFFKKENINFYLLKHRDIPKLVYEGILDFGVTSEDWIEEFGKEFDKIKSLDWCDTRTSVISSTERRILSLENELRCVTEFPNIAKRYFSEIGMHNVEVVYISGSSESLVPSIYDCCVDCVETGDTLKLHDLIEEEIINNSKVTIITKKSIDENKREHMLKILKMGKII